LTLYNSILSGSSGGTDLAQQQQAGSATVNAASPHVNIVQTSTISSGTFNNSGVSTANPNLVGLANNGGPTLTMLPSFTGPAIDKGNTADAAGLLSDQRGFVPRIVNGTVDLGAVEILANPPTLTSTPPPPPTPTSGSSGGTSPSASATASQLSRVALDAFLVAEGIVTGNQTLSGLGAADVLLFIDGLPADVQTQLRSAFAQDTIALLAGLNLTGPR
jgi:hypothetical protein